jgi:hypothetical protein
MPNAQTNQKQASLPSRNPQSDKARKEGPDVTADRQVKNPENRQTQDRIYRQRSDY